MTPASPRQRYVPSGRFDPARTAVVLIWLVGASAAIAGLYLLMLLNGWYYSAISITFPLLIATGFCAATVRYGHCRSRLLAGVLGVACGLGGYLTYFHLDQCVRWQAPPLAVHRLPGYIAFRLDTDHWRWLHKGAVLEPLPLQNGVQPQLPLANVRLRSWSWGLFLFDLAALSIAPLATGIATARRPYSEKQRRWCEGESLFIAKRSGADLRTALREDSVAAWALAEPRRAAEHEPHCKITAWYAPWDQGTEFDGEVFLSLDGGPCWQLTSTEGAALMNLLPAMQDIVAQALTSSGDATADPADPTLTRIWPVPARYAGPKQTAWDREMDQIKGGLLVGAPVAAALLALVGGTMLLEKWNALPDWALPIYVVGVGLPTAIFAKIWLHPTTRWEARMARCDQLVREMIARRPDAIVLADDPQSTYAELLPRRFWEGGRKPSPHETNEGLLRIDSEADTLLLEAENQRLSIPAASILQARIENLPGVSPAVEGLYSVVLRVRTAAGVRELPRFPLRGLASGNWNRASTLLARLEWLCNRSLGEQPTQPPPPREVPLPV